MTRIATLILFALTTAPAVAQSFTVFHDLDHAVIGTATRSGNTTYFRDAKGELTRTTRIDPHGNKTLLDPGGNVVGKTTRSGNVTTVYDADGVLVGTATESGGIVILRDADGKVTGSGKVRAQ